MSSTVPLLLIICYFCKGGGFFLGTKQSEVECGKQMIRKQKIVGGSEAYEGEFPFIVSIRMTNFLQETLCGGAILSNQWILTAAHCVHRLQRNNPPLAVYFGINGCGNGTEGYVTECQLPAVNVEQVVVHPAFTSHTFDSDIALLRLNKPLNFSCYRWPVCLPRSSTQLYDREAVAAGWGILTDSGIRTRTLHKVTLPVMNISVCQEMYDEAVPQYNIHLQQSQMCAGYKEGKRDTCQGDSGGPLFVLEEGKFTVIGLVSAGVACALPLLPGIYTNVRMFLPWISEIMYSTH